jgi:hypothetical protein
LEILTFRKSPNVSVNQDTPTLPLSLKTRATRAFLFLPLRGSLTMRDCYAGTATAVRDALTVVVAHTAPLLTGHAPNVRLRVALVTNLLTRTRETAVSLAQRCGVHRNTVAEHTAILEAALTGTRQQAGEPDAALTRVDTLLREAGIVREETQPQAA